MSINYGVPCKWPSSVAHFIIDVIITSMILSILTAKMMDELDAMTQSHTC